MIMALEARVLKALASNITLAKKKILEAQLHAAILGSEMAVAQLEAELPDNQEISRAHYTPPTPVHIPPSDKEKTLSIASTIARASIMEAFRRAAIATYTANLNADGWIWVTHIGPNTCDFCISMDGTSHPLTEAFESHNNCHCTTSPYIA